MPDDQRPAGRNLVPAAPMGLRPTSFAELEKLAIWFADSTAVPKDFRGNAANCFVAIQMGSELGLAPMQSIQNIAVINGRPAVFGDAMLGLCLQSPICIGVTERFEGSIEGNDLVAICVARRNGAEQPIERRFSVADAQRAALWGKDGPWTFYPARMLQFRARAFALRDAFPDVLRGLSSAEELHDTFDGTTIDGSATVVHPPTGTPPPPESSPPPPNTPPPPQSPTWTVPTQAPDGAPASPPPVSASPTAGNGTATNGSAKPRKTWTMVLDAFELAINDATTSGQVGITLTSEDVMKAKDFLKEGQPAKQRYDELVKLAFAKGERLRRAEEAAARATATEEEGPPP